MIRPLVVKSGTSRTLGEPVYGMRVLYAPGGSTFAPDGENAARTIIGAGIFFPGQAKPWEQLSITCSGSGGANLVAEIASSLEDLADMLSAGPSGPAQTIDSTTNSPIQIIYGSQGLPVTQDAGGRLILAGSNNAAFAQNANNQLVVGGSNGNAFTQSGANRLQVELIDTGGSALKTDAGNGTTRLITGSDSVQVFQTLLQNLNVAGQNEAGNHYIPRAGGAPTTATQLPIDLTNYRAAEFMVCVTTAITGSTTFAWFVDVLDQNLAAANVIDTVAMGTTNNYLTVAAAGIVSIGSNSNDGAAPSRGYLSRRARYVRVRYNLTGALTGGVVSYTFNAYP